MPSRMIHYLIAEKVAEQVKIENQNRFKLGSLCPDMSCRLDESKNRTHYMEVHGDKKGGNWITFVSKYADKMKQVVEFLLEHETMSGQQFADCMAGQEIGDAKETTLFDSFQESQE